MSPDSQQDDTAGGCDRAALRWIAQHLDYFAPPRVLDDDSQCKPLLELIVLMIYRLREQSPLDASSAEIVDRLAGLAESPALRDKPILNRHQLVLRAGVCAILAVTDRRDRAQELAIQRIIDTGLIEQAERLPHHIMIERTVFDWGGFRHGLPSLAQLTPMTMLVRQPDALYQTTSSAYELTHDIMFGYMLGERDAGELAPERDRVHRLLTDALVRFQREGHWDLVGELLMCWDTLDLPRDPVYEAGWSAFTAMQDVDGSIPAVSRPGSPEPEDSDESDESTSLRTRFDERYHTTLVMVFAATARSRRERGVIPPAAHALGSAADPSTMVDAAWLDHLVDRGDTLRTSTVLVSSLIGLTLIAAVDPAASGYVDKAVTRISQDLLAPTQLAGVPATLTLTAFGILRDRGVDVPAITGFVDAIRAVVTGTPPNAATALTWCEKLVVLSQLGHADPPVLPKSDDVWRSIDRRVGGDLTDTWQLAGACTGYGTSPRRALSDGDEFGVRRLEALGVDALRRRDLIAGCALLRAAHALRPLHHERLRAVTTFLEAQQSPHGGYGLIDPVVLRSPAQATNIDVDIDVRLPISLAVWWALAELNTDFRLFAWDRARATTPPIAVPS
jgi:hypothetical protein